MKRASRLGVAAALLAGATPACAFPAPDLVINLFGSGAQLIGMLAAGGGAAWFGLARDRAHGRTRSRPAGHAALLALAGLLLAALAGNLWQYWSHAEAQARRLQSNLLRAAPGGHAVQRALALPRDEMQAWLAQGKSYRLIDVREPEEFELGYLPGARSSRYADLLGVERGLLADDMPNVLVCDSGYRSGEICTRLAEMGVPCRFIDGGYAAWIAERRPMSGPRAGHGAGLQALPRYRTDSVLLDTPAVDRLVRRQGARFIDVRPPDEFRQGHLPGAINLPVREAPSAELNAALAALPKSPLIAACYDNRSCFYSKAIGLRLTRLGADYRGRYTVPHEYPVPARLSGSLALRRADAALEQGMAILVGPPRTLLEMAQRLSGGLAAGIVALALLVRLLAAPMTLLAERDRRRLPQLATMRAAWQRQYGDDEVGEQRAWRRLLRRAGVRPWRNLLFGLLQLLLLAGCAAAVHDIAQQYAGTGSPYAPWADPDPTHLLPVLLALACAACMAAPLRSAGRWRWPILIVMAGAMLYAADSMSLALDLYLSTAMLLLLMQQCLLPFMAACRAAWRRFDRAPAGLAALADADTLVGAGGKAVSLAHMARAGLPVPDGVVLDAAMWSGQGAPAVAQRRALAAVLRRLGGARCRYAVRSSAPDEDGIAHSQAGRYVSLLDVPEEGVAQAIDTVCCAQSGGGVIVQRMVAADHAGVLFTEHPQHAGRMLVEFAAGAGAVVDGAGLPRAISVGLASGIADAQSGLDLSPLTRLARRVETLFGTPQDIEWACAQGRYYLLQARPITRRVVDGDSERALRERERRRLLDIARAAPHAPHADWLVTDAVAAELPRASVISLALLEQLHGPGGATDLAWRRLGFDYLDGVVPRWTTAFGHTRLLQPAGDQAYLKPGLLAQFRFSRAADRAAGAFERDFLPPYRHAVRLRGALDLARLETAELQTLLRDWSDDFIKTSYVEAEVLNLAAKLFAETATQLLRRRGCEPALYLRPDGDAPDLAAARQLLAVRDGATSMADFLDVYGHRAGHDFELSEARHGERPAWLEQWQASLPPHLPAAAPAPPLPRGRVLAAAVQRARRYITLKEVAKHECMKALASLRRLLLELDRRWRMDGAIFNFTLEELERESAPDAATVRARAAAIRQEQAAFAGVPMPAVLSVRALELLELGAGHDSADADADASAAPRAGKMRGVLVSGGAGYAGVVCVRRDPSVIETLPDGAILVLPSADPAWIPWFPRAAGIICDSGGLLCHAAIMAREYGVPALFGAAGASTRLCDGEHVTVDVDGRIVLAMTR
ncbi:MAG: rhodanese-like domain-containing protein [Pseudomonadota bacterium]